MPFFHKLEFLGSYMEGLDYLNTYFPVMRINSIRMVLPITALRNLEVHQMDVKTVFLNGDLEEEIYMEQPCTLLHSTT